MLKSKFACGSSRLFCFVHMEDFLCSSEFFCSLFIRKTSSLFKWIFFLCCSYGRLALCSSGQCCSYGRLALCSSGQCCSYGRLPLCSSGQCCSLLFIWKTSSLFRWNILFFVHKKHLLFMQTESSALFTLKICSLFKWKAWLFVHIKDFIFVQAKSSALFTLKI